MGPMHPAALEVANWLEVDQQKRKALTLCSLLQVLLVLA